MTFVFGSNLRQWRGCLGAAVDMEDDPYISPSDICVFLRMDEILDLMIFGLKTNMRLIWCYICTGCDGNKYVFIFYLINAEQINIWQAIEMC